MVPRGWRAVCTILVSQPMPTFTTVTCKGLCLPKPVHRCKDFSQTLNPPAGTPPTAPHGSCYAALASQSLIMQLQDGPRLVHTQYSGSPASDDTGEECLRLPL